MKQFLRNKLERVKDNIHYFKINYVFPIKQYFEDVLSQQYQQYLLEVNSTNEEIITTVGVQESNYIIEYISHAVTFYKKYEKYQFYFDTFTWVLRYIQKEHMGKAI